MSIEREREGGRERERERGAEDTYVYSTNVCAFC